MLVWFKHIAEVAALDVLSSEYCLVLGQVVSLQARSMQDERCEFKQLTLPPTAHVSQQLRAHVLPSLAGGRPESSVRAATRPRTRLYEGNWDVLRQHGARVALECRARRRL